MLSFFPLKPTREGIFVISMAFLFGISAVNTGLNLVYLLFSSLLAFIILAGIFAAKNLKSLHMERKVAPFISEGEKLEISWEVKNKSYFWPLWSISWEDLLETKKTLPNLFLPYLAGKGERTLKYTVTPQKRGVWKWKGCQVESYFPFGFFHIRHFYDQKDRVLIFPKIYQVKKSFWGILGRFRNRQNWDYFEGEFLTLREYVPGDAIHSIHWKSSAKHGILMVRQEEKFFPKEVHLFLAPGEGEKAEVLIRFCASIIYFCYQKNISVSLTSEGKDGTYIPPGRGKKHILSLLEHLALFQPLEKREYPFLHHKRQKASGVTIGFLQKQLLSFSWTFTPNQSHHYLDLSKTIPIVS